MMAERGFLDGSRMANVFNMMRPRDLIWPYIVNNYMLGKKPFPFDLLYWNQDSTRMTAANHGYYLREFYHENRLAPGEMSIGGVKLDLEQGQAADLRVGGQGRPHRPGEVGVHRRQVVRRPGRVRARGLRPHRRRDQPAGQDQIPVLDRAEVELPTLEDWLSDAKETPAPGGRTGRMAARAFGNMMPPANRAPSLASLRTRRAVTFARRRNLNPEASLDWARIGTRCEPVHFSGGFPCLRFS